MKTFMYIANEEFNVRDRKDRRKKVNRITVAYKGIDGEYRKSFTFPINVNPSYPMEIK